MTSRGVVRLQHLRRCLSALFNLLFVLLTLASSVYCESSLSSSTPAAAKSVISHRLGGVSLPVLLSLTGDLHPHTPATCTCGAFWLAFLSDSSVLHTPVQAYPSLITRRSDCRQDDKHSETSGRTTQETPHWRLDLGR